jgi:Sec-independent protein translocase protein TatA
MPFDFGLSYTHLLVLGLIAFMVIGKNDMPIVLRKFGQFMAKVRSMSREFQGHVDLAMKDAGVASLKNDLQGLKSNIDGAVSMPSLQAGQTTPTSSYKTVEFEKLFTSRAGETIVAGKPVEIDQASKA